MPQFHTGKSVKNRKIREKLWRDRVNTIIGDRNRGCRRLRNLWRQSWASLRRVNLHTTEPNRSAEANRVFSDTRWNYQFRE